MDNHTSVSQAATEKAQTAIRALFEVITLTWRQEAAIEFVHKLSIMHLPEEVLEGIDLFTENRHRTEEENRHRTEDRQTEDAD